MYANNFLAVIKKRKTVRRFKKDIPPEKDITAILNAACHAPYGGGTEPWKFILVPNKEKIEALSEALKKKYPEVTYEFGTYFVDAPVVVAAAWRPIHYPLRSEEIEITGPNVWENYKQDITVGYRRVFLAQGREDALMNHIPGVGSGGRTPLELFPKKI